ncbi:hypothetical protein ABEB36_011793 [Hypothenemus hampei]|uniref:Division abnormally delayed protein n=1 Tax=Hypothenemus hampei TaxID=57062 RepID=A0ABD1E915_HYPHA
MLIKQLTILILINCVWCVVGKNTRYKRQQQDDVSITSSSGNSNKRHHQQQQGSCGSVIPFFMARNISIDAEEIDNNQGPICGGKCCNTATESQLKHHSERDFANLLGHNSKSLLGPLSRTSAMLQNHVWDLADQSQNKTLHLFAQVYQGMAGLAQPSIDTLYRDVREYVRADDVTTVTRTPDDIQKSVDRFFTELFPLAYHHQSGLTSDNFFTTKYKQCLKDNIQIISPFGDFPKEVSDTLAKSLENTRRLLEALQVGIAVLNATNHLILQEQGSASTECHLALMRMTYCSKCQGFKSTRPCSGYCLNVLRGCTSKYVNELDLPWNGYVEGIESLVMALRKSNVATASSSASNNGATSSGVDSALRNLDTQISSAIMYFMVKIGDIDRKIKMNCKIPETSPIQKDRLLENNTSVKGIFTKNGVSRSFPHFPEIQLAAFLSTISNTKGFYGDLADNLCKDPAFVELKDKECWNGERIGEYTKTVVGIAANTQKYNPEVKIVANIQQMDPKIASLVDNLRHVHHMALNTLAPNYSEADYNMQRDGVDGSGSGNGPDTDVDDDEFSRGSGSGHGPIDTDIDITGPRKTDFFDHNNVDKPDQTSSVDRGAANVPGSYIVLITLCWLIWISF